MHFQISYYNCCIFCEQKSTESQIAEELKTFEHLRAKTNWLKAYRAVINAKVFGLKSRLESRRARNNWKKAMVAVMASVRLSTKPGVIESQPMLQKTKATVGGGVVERQPNGRRRLQAVQPSVKESSSGDSEYMEMLPEFGEESAEEESDGDHDYTEMCEVLGNEYEKNYSTAQLSSHDSSADGHASEENKRRSLWLNFYEKIKHRDEKAREASPKDSSTQLPRIDAKLSSLSHSNNEILTSALDSLYGKIKECGVRARDMSQHLSSTQLPKLDFKSSSRSQHDYVREARRKSGSGSQDKAARVQSSADAACLPNVFGKDGTESVGKADSSPTPHLSSLVQREVKQQVDSRVMMDAAIGVTGMSVSTITADDLQKAHHIQKSSDNGEVGKALIIQHG